MFMIWINMRLSFWINKKEERQDEEKVIICVRACCGCDCAVLLYIISDSIRLRLYKTPRGTSIDWWRGAFLVPDFEICLVVFVHPFDEFYTVVIMSVYEAGMSRTFPKNPFGVWNSVCHCFGNERRAKIGDTAADQRRDLDLTKSVNVLEVLESACRCKLIWSPSFVLFML